MGFAKNQTVQHKCLTCFTIAIVCVYICIHTPTHTHTHIVDSSEDNVVDKFLDNRNMSVHPYLIISFRIILNTLKYIFIYMYIKYFLKDTQDNVFLISFSVLFINLWHQPVKESEYKLSRPWAIF